LLKTRTFEVGLIAAEVELVQILLRIRVHLVDVEIGDDDSEFEGGYGFRPVVGAKKKMGRMNIECYGEDLNSHESKRRNITR
jgi:hypothetical protein